MQQKGTPKQIKNYIYFSQNRLGKGSFSVVYLGHHINTNQTVAIKVIDVKSLKTDIERMLVGYQMKALKLINHQNVIRANQIYQTANNIYIIYDYCQLGDLQSYIKSKSRIPEEEALHIIKQLISGVIHIHSRGVIHRDLKPQNILIQNHSKDKIFKIIDFGFCEVGEIKFQQPYNVGSPLYMSPEAYKLSKYSTKSDSWALGIIFLEMLLGDLPFRGIEYDILLQQLANGEPYKHLNCSQLSKDLLSKLLSIDAQKRIDPIEAYNLLTMNKIESTKVLGTNNFNIIPQGKPNYTPNNEQNKFSNRPKPQFIASQRNIRGSIAVNQSPAPKAKPRDISPAKPLDKALAYLKPKQPTQLVEDFVSLNRNQSLYKLKLCDKLYLFLKTFQTTKDEFIYSDRILLLGLKVIKQYLQSVTILFQEQSKTLTDEEQEQLCNQINKFNQIQARYSQNTLFSDLYFSFAIEYLKLEYEYFNYLQFWIKGSMEEMKKKVEKREKQPTDGISKSYLYLIKINELLEFLKKNPIYKRTDILPQDKLLDMMINQKSQISWNNILDFQQNHQKLPIK